MASLDLSSFDEEEMEQFLLEQGVPAEVTTTFRANLVSGDAFVCLTEEDLKELCPPIGVRTKIRRILKQVVGDGNVSPTCSGDPGLDNEAGHGPSPSSRAANVAVAREPLGNKDPVLNIPQQQPSPKWHLDFEIPERRTFSGSVQASIDTGVVTSKARREIVQVLRTLILQYTRKPSGEQYTEVVRKLVTKYPKLKDENDDGYGDWKMSLRTSFKNWRKDRSDENSSGDTVTVGKAKKADGNGPPSKRFRITLEDQCDDEEEYLEAIKELRDEWRRGKRERSLSTIKKLLDKTSARRRQWIVTAKPMVSDVMESFPCFSSARAVRREFRSLFESDHMDSFKDNWALWREQIVRLSQIESTSRPLIGKLLITLGSVDGLANKEDHKNFYGFQLLMRLLYPRGAGKNSIFMKHFETCDVDLQNEVSRITQAEPYIVICGTPGQENTQYFVCIEQAIAFESKSLLDAVADAFSCYFVFDILYPKSLSGMYMFVQENLCNIKDNTPRPSCLSKLMKNCSALV